MHTTTSLKDSEGNMLLAAETAITTESEEFAAVVVRRSASGIENIKNLKAWDAEGKALTVEHDSEAGRAVFGGVPEKITYDYDSGFHECRAFLVDNAYYRSN